MKNNLQRLVILLLQTTLLVSTLIGQTATAPSAGDGSEGNPYQISSLDNLYWLSQNSSEWASGKYFIQTASIDASTTSSWDGGNGFTPIGNSSTKFEGNYNGNGHSILALYMDGGNGLFGVVEHGKIKNLGLTNSSISSGYDTGALVGLASYGTIISNCYSSGNVTGNSDVGGLVGEVYNATVNQCFTTCTVSGNNRSGGFTGSNYNGTINNCYSMGDVTRLQSNGEDFGGFCGLGLSTATIEYCYSTGRVQYDNGSNPYNKGFLGNISGSGGTYKSNFFDTQSSHQSSDATGTANPRKTMVLQNAGTYTNLSDFWDFINNPNYDNQNENIWGISPLVNNGYPFLAWTGYTNYLEQPSTGDGSSGNPYQITDLQDLYWASQTKTKGKYFTQTSNIDASTTSTWCGGMGFIPIGTYSDYTLYFSGNYDGNGHSIDGLFINREDNYIGLFGYAQDGIIKNIGVTNVNIDASTYVAALAGYLTGSGTVVTNCYSSGTVTGSYYVGGLVGDISTSANVNNCYSSCSATGYQRVGGLLGQNYEGIVRNSYSKGTVKRQGGSSVYLGGFCGYTYNATIDYCYSTGKVEYNGTSDPTDRGFLGAESGNSTYTANFFDSETSLQTFDVAGAALAKTTSEMKDYTTFTTAGWDFVNETDNGSGDYWDADQNSNVNDGYVILSWQSGADNTLPVELTTFSASVIDNKVNLNWQTATEVNNYGFEVERKQETESWEKVTFIEGHGNSNSPKDYLFVDNAVNTGKYLYRLKQIDINGAFEYSKVIEVKLDTPNKFELSQNYPNPFNPSTKISYSIPNAGHVILKVYNVLGKEIITIINKKQIAGKYEVKFDAGNLASGIYFYSLLVNDYSAINRMILMK